MACRQKACCHTTIVPTGRDVWRIARGLGVPPQSFLSYFESTVARRDAFQLDWSERRFCLALVHQQAQRTATAPPCIFLLRTRQRHHRCALGPLRPLLCQSYPSQVVDGILYLRPDNCTCRSWNLADLDMARERALVSARQDEAEEYCWVVAQWNARVQNAVDGAQTDFGAYCAFLLQTYDALAATAGGDGDGTE
jgi:hypothetical protein